MFAGIGGFREGLTRAGDFVCVGHCEIDKHADRSYRALFDMEGEWFLDDIRKADPADLPDFDLLCGGFPCQSFSIAGSRGGFDDPRGTLFFELARLAEARHPKYWLAENVPGLLDHDGGRTFAAILREMEKLGYFVEWQVLNSADFGVPQARKRVYLIGYLDAEIDERMVKFHMADVSAPVRKSRMALRELENQLEDDGFLRIHNSFLVNMNYISSLQTNGVTLTIGQTLPISLHGYRGIKKKYMVWRGRG